MLKVRVVRVFTDDRGMHGNPLGVIEDDQQILDAERRQLIAAKLGYSETVFLDDLDAARISTYSGQREVPFAGHAAVGAAWVLGEITGTVPGVLHTAGGNAPAWVNDQGTWVRSLLGSTPAWWHERLPDANAVEALTGPLSPDQDMTQLWAWEDESAGTMRVRTFASRAGIEEDEACGSGAMRMAAALGRGLTLHHGKGSVIYARPGPPGYADVGGRVTQDAPRVIDA